VVTSFSTLFVRSFISSTSATHHSVCYRQGLPCLSLVIRRSAVARTHIACLGAHRPVGDPHWSHRKTDHVMQTANRRKTVNKPRGRVKLLDFISGWFYIATKCPPDISQVKQQLHPRPSLEPRLWHGVLPPPQSKGKVDEEPTASRFRTFRHHEGQALTPVLQCSRPLFFQK